MKEFANSIIAQFGGVKMKKIICLVLSVIMISTCMMNISLTAFAINIDDTSVFIKQEGSDWCTYASATNMIRRRAILDGNSNWSSYTDANLRNSARASGGGMLNSFSYAGYGVKAENWKSKSTEQKKSSLISLLSSHPEGVVIYTFDGTYTHAILACNYTNGTFYVNDPAKKKPSGIIKLTEAQFNGSSQDDRIGWIKKVWYISSGAGTGGTYTPAPPPAPSAPAEISLSSNTINLDYPNSASKTITVTATGNLPSKYKFELSINSTLNYQWDSSWSGNSIKLTVSANQNSVSSSNATIYLKDSSNDSICDYVNFIINVSKPVVKEYVTVHFDSMGGSTEFASQTVEKYGTLKTPDRAPNRTGHTFLGWSTDADATNGRYSPNETIIVGSNDIVLYAIWKKKQINWSEWNLNISNDELYFGNDDYEKTVIVKIDKQDDSEFRFTLEYTEYLDVDFGDEWYDEKGYFCQEIIVDAPYYLPVVGNVTVRLRDENDDIVDSVGFKVFLEEDKEEDDVFEDRNTNGITVYLNGEKLYFDVEPQIINNRTMVPLRAIFEALGAKVMWDNDTQTVTATRDAISVVATIGNKTMYVNNSKKTMDVAPVIINSRTLVPARFVAEAFDCDVNWDGILKTVEITSYHVDDNEVYDEIMSEKETRKDSSTPRHAPNMYIDWIADNEYDVISVDWYCDKDALNTYWAVHNWDNGYAGFQNKDGEHVLLLSLWDLADGTTPSIEYVLDGQNGDFGGEGTGKQVFTNYDWQVGKWYSMCIQISGDNNKTYYTQYVKEENGDWIKTAVISYPVTGSKFYGTSMFQEDFTFNNLMRSCRLRNSCGRIYGTNAWESWNKCLISNSFFPTDEATWESGVQNNINFNCDWKNYTNYVWVQSGGKGFESIGKQIPIEYSLNNSSIPPRSLFESKKEPDNFDEPITLNQIIEDGIYVIATKLNLNYVLDIDGAGKSNGDNLQLWERNNTPAQSFKVTHIGNGYYRIVNTNSGKAIDAEWGGTESGTNVWQYDVNDTPAQIWKIVSAGNNSYYIINKESGLYLDVDNAYADSGTNVKLFDCNDMYDAQKWCFNKQ